MKPGDSLLMQFGHNDGGPLDDAARARGTIRGNGEETRDIDNPILHKRETVHTYGWYLRQYVAEAKAKGAAACIICSPVPHNSWEGDKVKRSPSFATPGTEAAKQAGADFIDLNDIAARHYEADGKEKVKTYFPEGELGHTNWAGAVVNARSVIEGLKGLEHCELAKYLGAEPPADLPVPAGK